MVLTGFGFVRAKRYEIFVAQHICAAATLLWLLSMHVPSYASYYIWMAVGFVVFDWSSRIVWVLLRNSHALSGFEPGRPGYSVQLEPLPGDMVRLMIKDVDFSWRSGQHAYISIPRLKPLELHPFTIANALKDDRRLKMVVKAHSGFSKTLLSVAEKYRLESRPYQAFISGPWGNPPDLLHYDTVVLVACSSGASFTVPLLQDLAKKECCARSVVFHWIVREKEHVNWYENEIRQVIEEAKGCRLRLQVVVHVTRLTSASTELSAVARPIDSGKAEANTDIGHVSASSSASNASSDDEKARSSQSSWKKSNARPTIESIIRPPVETALGETAVVVCGGLSVTAQARTFVAALSDERGIHKGTGAQGIFLFTETYGW